MHAHMLCEYFGRVNNRILINPMKAESQMFLLKVIKLSPLNILRVIDVKCDENEQYSNTIVQKVSNILHTSHVNNGNYKEQNILLL